MRQTPLLSTVLALLKTAGKPVSVLELQSLLVEQHLTPNKTTLYRMLEKLTEADQVEALLLDAHTSYYELKTHHHHHFRCQSCETIRCLTDPELETKIHSLEAKLEAKGFEVNRHHFSLSGKCAVCA